MPIESGITELLVSLGTGGVAVYFAMKWHQQHLDEKATWERERAEWMEFLKADRARQHDLIQKVVEAASTVEEG